MPKTGLLIVFVLLATTLSLRAQRRLADDTAHYRSVPIPAHLQPIERAYGSSSVGSVYFYGGRRLSSPYSLEIPFYELDDPAVSHHFRTFRTLTTISRLTSLATLVYVLFNPNGRNGTYYTVYGGSVAASLTLLIVGNSQVNKAVTRYNQLLRQPRVGLSSQPVPLTGRTAVGAGMAWTF